MCLASCCGMNSKPQSFPETSLKARTASESAWVSKPISYSKLYNSSAAVWIAIGLRCRHARDALGRGSALVNAPLPCAMAGDIERNEAINHRELAVIHDRKEMMRLMLHEVGHSHFTAGHERGQRSEQPDQNQDSAYQFNAG